jgi:hypothetical protein
LHTALRKSSTYHHKDTINVVLVIVPLKRVAEAYI